MLLILKELFWYSVQFGFKLTACFLAGKLNVMNDRISWLHDFECACEAFELLYVGKYPICSLESFAFLQESWRQV